VINVCFRFDAAAGEGYTYVEKHFPEADVEVRRIG